MPASSSQDEPGGHFQTVSVAPQTALMDNKPQLVVAHVEDEEASETSEPIQVVSVLNETCKELVLIETENGQKTSIQITIDPDSKGWMFGRSLTTGVDLLAVGEGEKFIGVKDVRASQSHFKLFRSKEGELFVVDVGSRNGTKVNGESIWPREERRLKRTDVISLGSSMVRLAGGPPEEEEKLTTKEDEFMSLSAAAQEDKLACFFCQLNLAKFSIVERSLHINACAEGVQKNDAVIASELASGSNGNVIRAVCLVCGKALDKLSAVQRSNHVNQCLDKQQQQQTSRKSSGSAGGARPPASLKQTAAAAVKKAAAAKGSSTGGKKKRVKKSGETAAITTTSTSTMTFAFTKQQSGVVADEMHEFLSDDELDPTLMAEKKRLREEAADFFEEDLDESKRFRNEQAAHARKERETRDVLLSSSLSSAAVRFPGPMQMRIRMNREALLRRKRHYESQLKYVDEMLQLEQDQRQVRQQQQLKAGLWTAGRDTTIPTNAMIQADEEELSSSQAAELISSVYPEWTVGFIEENKDRTEEWKRAVQDMQKFCQTETEDLDKRRATKLLIGQIARVVTL